MVNYKRTLINMVLAFVCILGGAWLPATQARGGSLQESRVAQTISLSDVPAGLEQEEWEQIVRQIQQDEGPSVREALFSPEIAKITASDGISGVGFGYSVSVSGDTLVAGAYWTTIDSKFAQGAAYVFSRNQGGANQWGEVKKLIANDGEADDRFGWGVAVNGDTIAVGAFKADIGGSSNQGAAYVFNRNQGGPDNWGQVRKLVGSDSVATDLFGRYIAISGDTIAVGAPEEYQEGEEMEGKVYIFYQDQGGTDNWGEVKKLTATDTDTVYNFGISVSISGDKIVVGANTFVSGNPNQGAAYVFYRDQGGTDNWGQVTRLAASDGIGEEDFGYRVSISGDTIIAGAREATVGENVGQGAAYVFNRHQGGADHWGEVKKLVASDGATADGFGSDVLINSDTILVGAVHVYGMPGRVYLFRRNLGGPDAWGELTKLSASDGAVYDMFGRSISLSQNTLVIGAYGAKIGENEEQGAAYVYYLFESGLFLPMILR